MGTKLQELRNGCFAKAMDDEPMFVLLACDVTAPRLVREWATQRTADISMGRKPASDMLMVDEAFRCADAMEAWRDENDGAWRTGLFGVPLGDVREDELEDFDNPDQRPAIEREIDRHDAMGESRDDMVRRGMLGRDS